MNPVKITETFKSLSYVKKKRVSQKSLTSGCNRTGVKTFCCFFLVPLKLCHMHFITIVPVITWKGPYAGNLEVRQIALNAQFIYQLNQLKLSWWSDYYSNWTNAKHVTENDQLNSFYNLTGAKALPIFLNVFLIHFPSKIKLLIIMKNNNNNNKWTMSQHCSWDHSDFLVINTYHNSLGTTNLDDFLYFC